MALNNEGKAKKEGYAAEIRLERTYLQETLDHLRSPRR